jgi:hypothetical protein
MDTTFQESKDFKYRYCVTFSSVRTAECCTKISFFFFASRSEHHNFFSLAFAGPFRLLTTEGLSARADLAHTIFDTCRDGNIDALKDEIEGKGLSVNTVDSNGNSLLHWAAFARQKALVSYLVEHGMFERSLE